MESAYICFKNVNTEFYFWQKCWKIACCLHKNKVGEGGIILAYTKLQQCMELCEKLKQELEDAEEIPPEKLSGELREALRELRRSQREKLDEISKKILI